MLRSMHRTASKGDGCIDGMMDRSPGDTGKALEGATYAGSLAVCCTPPITLVKGAHRLFLAPRR